MGEQVLANRDYHLWNILAARREPWLLIDPKPLAGEPAFDTGHFLRTVAPEGLDRTAVDQLVDRLAAELDLDAERVRLGAGPVGRRRALGSRDLRVRRRLGPGVRSGRGEILLRRLSKNTCVLAVRSRWSPRSQARTFGA